MTGEPSPSAGWWRSGNGEWYPPESLPQGWSVGPDGVPRSFVLPTVVPSPTRPPSPWARVAESYRRWPAWAKVAPVAVLVLVATAAAAATLHDGGEFDSRAPTLALTGTATTGRATTGTIPPAPVSVNGLVITVPPTLATTTASTPTNPASSATTTTRLNGIAVPSSTASSPTTGSPTIATTTTTVAPTTVPTIDATTTTTSTTVPPTTQPPTTVAPTTVPPTTEPPSTTVPPTTVPPTTTTTTRPPVTHTVTGTVLVDSRQDVSGTCAGSGQFAAFHNGQTIALLGPTGQVVGQGVLTGCRWTDWRFSSGSFTAKPEFSFSISGVAEVSSYRPRVTSMTWPAVSLTAITNAGWSLDLEVD